jgi:hypothetical protein
MREGRGKVPVGLTMTKARGQMAEIGEIMKRPAVLAASLALLTPGVGLAETAPAQKPLQYDDMKVYIFPIGGEQRGLGLNSIERLGCQFETQEPVSIDILLQDVQQTTLTAPKADPGFPLAIKIVVYQKGQVAQTIAVGEDLIGTKTVGGSINGASAAFDPALPNLIRSWAIGSGDEVKRGPCGTHSPLIVSLEKRP